MYGWFKSHRRDLNIYILFKNYRLVVCRAWLSQDQTGQPHPALTSKCSCVQEGGRQSKKKSDFFLKMSINCGYKNVTEAFNWKFDQGPHLGLVGYWQHDAAFTKIAKYEVYIFLYIMKIVWSEELHLSPKSMVFQLCQQFIQWCSTVRNEIPIWNVQFDGWY